MQPAGSRSRARANVSRETACLRAGIGSVRLPGYETVLAESNSIELMNSFFSPLTRCLCIAAPLFLEQARAQAPAPNPAIPEWAYPGTATHKQVPPPADFRRPS